MININSFCFGHLGVQKHGYNFILALSQYDEIALFPWDSVPYKWQLSTFWQRCLLNAKKDVHHNIGIGIGVMNRMPYIVGEKKIAFTVWETSKIPVSELDYLKDVDEIWIPSTWGKQILENNRVDSKKIQVIPEGVDTNLYKPHFHQKRFSLSRRFRFLCVAKWEKRKGIDILLRAYANTFRPNEPVELMLHCYNPQTPHFKIKSAIANLNLPSHPPIRYSSPVKESTMVKIYNNCDAFVLPSRAEGWGLPIIEAMACAKPVIVTDYSAYRDFVSLNNGYLINVKKMVKVNDPDFFSSDLDYGEWAEPDGEHLEWLLRYVFEHQQEAINIGKIARENVVNSWTWKHAAQKAWEQLQ